MIICKVYMFICKVKGMLNEFMDQNDIIYMYIRFIPKHFLKCIIKVKRPP